MDQLAELTNLIPGLKAIYDECLRIYPDQPNPLQVSALVKCWLGGPDPLDYISMYSNPGNEELHVPPHWHYISFGLSDLYFDNRIHRAKNQFGRSGYGFELSFRLKKEPLDGHSPPLWPANLLQSLAKYVFFSGNPFWVGDHVSWHCPLDGSSESRLQHMLIAQDPQLEKIQTPVGSVEFVQIVGITPDELQIVQHWNGLSLLELLTLDHRTGGPYLITNMRRGESILEINPALEERVNEGIENDGSNLSGVTCDCSWTDDAWKFYDGSNIQYLSPELKSKLTHLMASKTLRQSDNVETNRDHHNSSNHNNHNNNNNDEDILSEALVDLMLSGGGGQQSKLSGSRNVNVNGRSRDNNGNNRLLGSGNFGLGDNLHLDSSLNLNDLQMSWSSTGSAGHNLPAELDDIKYYDNIHLKLTLEAGLLIPLALKGRVKHGRHFTFKSAELAITLVDSRVEGSWCDLVNPFASKANWLQILIEPILMDEILEEFQNLHNTEGLALPQTYLFPKWHFAITLQ